MEIEDNMNFLESIKIVNQNTLEIIKLLKEINDRKIEKEMIIENEKPILNNLIEELEPDDVNMEIGKHDLELIMSDKIPNLILGKKITVTYNAKRRAEDN